MQSQPRQTWLGVLLLIGVATLWSTCGLLIKLLHHHGLGMPAITIAAYRSLIGGLALVPFAWRHRRTCRQVSSRWFAGAALTFTLMCASFVAATARTSSANAILLQYTAPLWVFLLSPLLLGEKAHWVEGVSLLAAMAGIAVIFFGSPPSDTGALWIALVSGVAYAGVILTLRGLRQVNPLMVACFNLLASGLLLLPAAARWGTLRIEPGQVGVLLALSLLQFAGPYVLLSLALKRVNAQHASLILLLETVLNPLWTFLFLSESVSGATWLGGLLILMGVMGWIVLGRGRQPD
jgi:drug/metabolite transporter, DME family